MAAKLAASIPLKQFYRSINAYENDEVTRLIIDSHDKTLNKNFPSLTVGDFRNWLLSEKWIQKV